MKLLSRTVTFNEAELRAELARLEKQFAAYSKFEDDVRDVMDFMEHDEHYDNLNDALAHLNSNPR